MQENRSYVTQLWANTLGGLGHHYMPHAGENHAHSTSFTRHATQFDQIKQIQRGFTHLILT